LRLHEDAAMLAAGFSAPAKSWTLADKDVFANTL
jgi:hypothetical protein